MRVVKTESVIRQVDFILGFGSLKKIRSELEKYKEFLEKGV
jgi:hypothetical protein